jgi:hypothetical protein
MAAMLVEVADVAFDIVARYFRVLRLVMAEALKTSAFGTPLRPRRSENRESPDRSGDGTASVDLRSRSLAIKS